MIRFMITSEPSKFQKIQTLTLLCLPILLGLLLFSLPLSTTGKSWLLGINTLSILILISKDREKAFSAITHPLSILALALWVWTLVATSWSPADMREQLDLIKHYSKLLFIPLFLFAFSYRRQVGRLIIPAFLLAMLITFLVSLLNFFGLTHWYSLDPTAMFHNHIMTSFMMAIASFISATYAYQSTQYRGLYTLLALLFSLHILFLNTGRMGYIIFFALSMTFLVQHLTKKQLWIGLGALLLVFGVVITQSNVIQNQLKVTQHHISIYQQGEKTTSVGLRFQFYEFAREAITQKPLLGHGTGSYHYLFSQTDRFKSAPAGYDDPHNQYLFIWFEQGLIGLIIWIAFLGYALWGTQKLSSQHKALAQGLIIAFAIGSLTDSYLFRSGTGFLFCMLIAFFYSRRTKENDDVIS